MGTGGLCRVRAIHIAALIKRYRHLNGELRYWQKHHADDIDRLDALRHACSLLAASLNECAPRVDIATLKPIHFRPPVPLPGAALTRAILAELRAVATPLSTEGLMTALLRRQRIVLASENEKSSLYRRVERALLTLTANRLVAERSGTWSLAHQRTLT